MAQRQYLLGDITTKKSQRGTGDYIYEIRFIDLTDLEIYTTIIDPTMRNWTRCHWDNICLGPIPYGIYTGLSRTQRYTQDGNRIISADSYPQLIEYIDPSDMHDILQEIIVLKNMA